MKASYKFSISAMPTGSFRRGAENDSTHREASGHRGQGIRRCSIILSENVQESEVLNPLYVRLDAFPRTNLTNTEKNVLCKVSPYQKWNEVWQEQFAITLPRTRNDCLTKLVYEIFNQVSLEQAELMAGLQFDQKQVTTNADRREHMLEFKALWRGLEKNSLPA